MTHRYASPADKLARQILKTAWRNEPRQLLTLTLIASWFVDASPEAIRAAMAHAVREGWLVEQNNAWPVTPAGEAIGRRSRAGVVNKKRRL